MELGTRQALRGYLLGGQRRDTGAEAPQCLPVGMDEAMGSGLCTYCYYCH